MLEITRGKIRTGERIVLYGVEGIGKSTFASQFPNPLFIDTEGSTNELDVARLPMPTSWEMLKTEVDFVATNPGICSTLVIDTADWAERLCIKAICDANKKPGIEAFGYGKGYTYLAEEFGKLLNRLRDISDSGVNILLTAHATMRKVEQPEQTGAYDHWELKMEKKTAPMVKEWATMLLFANYKVMVITDDNGNAKARGGDRVLYTSHHASWDAKNRKGFPDMLPFSYDSIADAIPVLVGQNPQQIAPGQESMPEPAIYTAPEEAKPAKPAREDLAQLFDLIRINELDEYAVRKAIASRGYMPAHVTLTEYPPELVGHIISVFDQVAELTKSIMEDEEQF